MSTEQSTRRFPGPAIGLEDPGYDQARAVVLGGLGPRPALIVREADVDDVAGVIALARRTGSELAVRSGGHSGAGHSTADGASRVGRRR